MGVIYRDYSRDKIGWFFGLNGWQLVTIAAASLPIFASIERGAWRSALVFLAGWVLVLVVTVTPVRGRSATGWLLATIGYMVGGLAGWTRFSSRAAIGRADDLNIPDLPGALAGIQIHDGPPTGPTLSRVAIIQNHATRTWAVTAAIVHPGIGLTDAGERTRQGTGLSELLDLASRTALIDEILFTVRTVPEDGAERDVWTARHRTSTGQSLAREVNEDLQAGLTRASVRTEAFITLVVPERRIGRDAKESGGGLEGRARVMDALMSEVEAHLLGAMAMISVHWLTSPELALACRTGFAPGDRAGIIEALALAPTDPAVNADIPWALAGPSGADSLLRHYSHDAWNTVSATIALPVRGAAIGALAPVLTPTEPGERRSLLVAYPILAQTSADRRSATSEWAADLGDELRVRAKVKQRAKARAAADTVRGMDAKLARGHAMTRPYAVAAVTVPKTSRVTEYGRRLDASVRRAGYAPLRLDLAQDLGFTASCIPLGVSLTRKGDG
ncbi:membrane protein [Intrasporangium chromatireducens Q5-1]|uniref:Membrane protein n=1 Tax=Intrasporangium chromatireducens Q5-1 TaxID=584657 RepID=W9GKL2_9MICO|nr:SCO6880 family protein [Intrasporangium chromatireducens]EWT06801.1 membrane protein [Intrasporangium chromatireducens Q5-1]